MTQGAKGENNRIVHKTIRKVIEKIIFHEPVQVEGFILYGGDGDTSAEREGSEKTGGGPQKRRGLTKPARIKRAIPHDTPAEKGHKQGKPDEDDREDSLDYRKLLVDPRLKINKHYIEEIYSLPKNKDIIVRDLIISTIPPREACAIYIEGISDRDTVNEAVLKPLMLMAGVDGSGKKYDIINIANYIKKNIIYSNQVDIHERFEDIIEKINYGATAVFIEGCPRCLLVETKGWDRRSVGVPETEHVIRGPHEAFNETLRSNTGLLRKAIRNPKLITEMLKIGERNKTDVAVLYLEDLANPRLVEEVKRRIRSIRTDYVGETGILEQFIEDHPFRPIPQVLVTERPDRVASFIMDGKVAILMDGNPNVLIVPTTLFALLHSPEDYYLRAPYGNMVRLLRVVASFLAIVTPGFYVAVTSFHQEMIPTDLLLAVAAARETVPFPTVVEVLLMEFAFEMIREAGVRIPGVIGNTLGIVGALILGQAAVQAGIVSPILIIVVALTGLASFAIPNYSMSFAFRGVRFFFTALAALFGFFGISAGLFVLLTSITGMKSFGVPILSPIGPRTRTGPDIVLRGPVWSMEERPDFLNTLDRRRQPNISRGWVKSLTGQEKQGRKEKTGQEDGNDKQRRQ